MAINETQTEIKTKGLYRILKEGGFSGDITSKTIGDFLLGNSNLDLETKNRFLVWKSEFEFWEKHAKIYPYMEIGAPSRDLIKIVESFIEPKPNEFWLDAGCGPGKMTEILWEKSGKSLKKIVGIDIIMGDLINQKMKGIPVLELKHANLGERLDFPNNYFDGIVSNIAIPYVVEFEGIIGKEGIKNIFKEMARILKPSGQFVWSSLCPNMRPIIGVVASIPDIIKNITKIPNLPSVATKLLNHSNQLRDKGNKKIYTFLSPQEWNEVLKEAGFIDPMWQFVLTHQVWVNKSFKAKK